MSYIDSHLLPGEQVRYRTRLHKIVFAIPTLVTLVGLAGAIFAATKQQPIPAALGGLVALIAAISALIPYRSSEFAVTDKRVIIKIGWMQRRTLELMLSKVEGVEVRQTIMGRVLNYGTIVVIGTGGTREQFTNIARPLDFRLKVQGQVSLAEDRRAQSPSYVLSPVDSHTPGRDERECPYCAEPILKKAKVCKHCGRAVAPLA